MTVARPTQLPQHNHDLHSVVMATYHAKFHLGADDSQQVTLETTPEDTESLEEYLARKLTEERFTAFPDGSGGFVLIATEKITRVDVRRIDE